MSALVSPLIPALCGHVFPVITDGSEEEMGRIHARRIVTAMADQHSFGNGTDVRLIRQPMGIDESTLISRHAQHPVPRWRPFGLPLPAFGVGSPIHFGPESGFNIREGAFTLSRSGICNAFPARRFELRPAVGTLKGVECRSLPRSLAIAACDGLALPFSSRDSVATNRGAAVATDDRNRMSRVLLGKRERLAALFADKLNGGKLSGHFIDLLYRSVGCHDPGRSNVAGSFAAFNFTKLWVAS